MPGADDDPTEGDEQKIFPASKTAIAALPCGLLLSLNKFALRLTYSTPARCH